MLSSHRIQQEILCIFIEAIQQVRHLGMGRESSKKSTNDIKRRAGSQKSGDVRQTNSSM